LGQVFSQPLVDGLWVKLGQKYSGYTLIKRDNSEK
jgi:hypothetical protein